MSVYEFQNRRSRMVIKCQTPLHGHRLRICCTTPPTSWHVEILGSRMHYDWQICCTTIVELLWACPLVVGVVQHVRSRCPCIVEFEHVYRMTTRCCTTNLASYGHVVQHLQLAVCLSVGGVVQQYKHVPSRCPCSGVWTYLQDDNKMLYNKFSRLRTCCTTSTTCCELVRWWCCTTIQTCP